MILFLYSAGAQFLWEHSGCFLAEIIMFEHELIDNFFYKWKFLKSGFIDGDRSFNQSLLHSNAIM